MNSDQQSFNDSLNNSLGIQFEGFTKKLMQKIGFSDVYTTQPSQDYGIDVIGRLNYHGWFGIQCKHVLNPKKHIGYRAVEEAVSGVKFYHLQCGIVFTNGSFTGHARKGAKKNRILLWNRNTQELLIRMFNSGLSIYDLWDYNQQIIPLLKRLHKN